MVIDKIKQLLELYKKNNPTKITSKITDEPLFSITSNFDDLVLSWATPRKPIIVIDNFLDPYFTPSKELPKKYKISFFDFQKKFLSSSTALPKNLANIFQAEDLIKEPEPEVDTSDPNEDGEGVSTESLLDSVQEFRFCLPSYKSVDGGFKVEITNKSFDGVNLKIKFDDHEISNYIDEGGIFLKLEGDSGIYTLLPFWIYEIYYSYKKNSKAWSFQNDLFIHALQKTREWLDKIGSNDELVLKDYRLNHTKIYSDRVDLNTLAKSLSHHDKYCVLPSCYELEEELNYSSDEETHKAIQRGLADWDEQSDKIDFKDSNENTVSLVLSQKAIKAFKLLKQNYFNKSLDEVKESILCYSDKSIRNLYPEFNDFFNFDPNAYGKRVIGVGELIKMPGSGALKSIYKSLLGEIDEAPNLHPSLTSPKAPLQKEIKGNTAFALNIALEDDPSKQIFLYQDELESVKQGAYQALKSNEPFTVIDRDTNKEYVMDLSKKSSYDFLRKGLNQIINYVSPIKTNISESNTSKNDNSYLQIINNYDKTGYSEIEESKIKSSQNLDLNFQKYLELLNLKPNVQARQHQQEGISWLVSCFLREYPGVIFADDMGLGKTFQAMCFIKILKSLLWQTRFLEPFTEPILIVVPQVLMKNFQEQARDFFTDHESFGFKTLHGPSIKNFYRSDIKFSSKPEHKIQEHLLDTEKLSDQKCIITTYDTLANYEKSLTRVSWSLLLCDEVQKAKSCNSHISSALKAIANKSTFKLLMSGTPIENDMREFWNLMDTTAPGLLGEFLKFKKAYPSFFMPCESDLERESDFKKLENTIKFGDLQAGIVNGRLKENIKDVIKDLSREDHNISFTLEQDVLNRIDEIKNDRLATVEKIQRIKFISVHKNLMDNNFENDYKHWVSNNSRLEKLQEILKNIKEKNEKVLVFCEYNHYQKIVQDMINAEFHAGQLILSPVNSKLDHSRREKTIRDFKRHDGFSGLVLSPKCAGMGLNLQEANHIIHLTRWWNPAVEDQATCRAYRIGQTKKVQVYYFIADTEFERNLNDRLEEKRKMRKSLFSLNYNQVIDYTDLISQKKTSKLRHPNEFDYIKASSPKEQGKIFEDYIKELYEALGYKVEALDFDDGIDWVISKDGLKIGVQVKHTNYHEYKGSIDVVERFPGTLVTNSLEHGVFITNGKYSDYLSGKIHKLQTDKIKWLDRDHLFDLYEQAHTKI
jgi:SNF2 family DNA or RNA helicase